MIALIALNTILLVRSLWSVWRFAVCHKALQEYEGDVGGEADEFPISQMAYAAQGELAFAAAFATAFAINIAFLVRTL